MPETTDRAARRSAPKTSQFRVPGEGSSLVISIATIVVLVVAWFAVTTAGLIKPLFLPSPQAVAQQFFEYLTGQANDKPLWQHFLASVLRVAAAFWLAFLPLIIIWFGIDELPKVLLIYLACFAPLALAARSGMKSATQEQINAAYSMGASYSQVVRHVVLPAAMPEILVGMRIAIGFGWTTLVAAEMVAANVGLGQMVLNASNFLRTDIVIMGIIVIGIVAYLFDLFMRWVELKFVPWKGRA
jgi:taurine transport system permease protein